MRQETVTKKVKAIDQAFDRIERGQYIGMSVGYLTDQIAWLWKYRHISYEEMTRLTARARYIISTYKPD